MRLVLLTGPGIEHRYLAGRLAAAFPSQLAAIIVAADSKVSPSARIRGLIRRYTVAQLASRTLARLHSRITGRQQKRLEAYRRILFPNGDDGLMPLRKGLHVVPKINGSETQALLRDIEPDVIAVYGTAMIRPPIIRLARSGILNMHTGISPKYRGSDTVFWPLYNEEPEWIGVTVHLLDEGIDSGPVLAVGRPAIEPHDDEDSLFAKCVRAGADLYVQAIRDVASGTAAPQAQDLRAGREYRFVDRTVSAELRVARLLESGLLRRAAGRT